MNDVNFPVTLTRPGENGSRITAYDLKDLQKVMMNELRVSLGYVSMCDASEIVGTFKRRGYWVKTVRYVPMDEDDE